MQAVEIDTNQPWRVVGGTIEDDGNAGLAERARACEMVWLQALKWYYTDCAASLKGVDRYRDMGESLSDLTGSRELLANLLRPLNADPNRVGDAFMAGLNQGRKFSVEAMSRAVVEQHERYGSRPRGRPRKVALDA